MAWVAVAPAAGNGYQSITHYWDCCMPSCGWDQGQGADRIPIKTMCNIDGSKAGKSGIDTQSACDQGGQAGVIMCPDQQPFFDKASQQWMGFVASQDTGQLGDCCDCYSLTFNTSQKMTVQITNHGQVAGVFDLLVPGGGFGQFNGCSKIFPHANGVPQDDYGGLFSPSTCETAFGGFPDDVAACRWMFTHRT